MHVLPTSFVPRAHATWILREAIIVLKALSPGKLAWDFLYFEHVHTPTTTPSPLNLSCFTGISDRLLLVTLTSAFVPVCNSTCNCQLHWDYVEEMSSKTAGTGDIELDVTLDETIEASEPNSASDKFLNTFARLIPKIFILIGLGVLVLWIVCFAVEVRSIIFCERSQRRVFFQRSHMPFGPFSYLISARVYSVHGRSSNMGLSRSKSIVSKCKTINTPRKSTV